MGAAESGRTVRPTPFEIVFEAGGFPADTFAELRTQVETQGATTMSELLALPAGGVLLRELTPEGAGDEHRELLLQTGALLFHAFRYWLHGRVVYRFSESVARALVAGIAEPWTYRAPAPAGYVQLPRNVFWARPAEAAAAEAVDGFFWSAPTELEGAHGTRLDLLLSLGVRPDRPGLTVVAVSLEPGSDPAQWVDVQARADGTDFDNILPGGELKSLHALTSHAEVLKLALRTFRHIDRTRDRIVEAAGVRLVE